MLATLIRMSLQTTEISSHRENGCFGGPLLYLFIGFYGIIHIRGPCLPQVSHPPTSVVVQPTVAKPSRTVHFYRVILVGPTKLCPLGSSQSKRNRQPEATAASQLGCGRILPVKTFLSLAALPRCSPQTVCRAVFASRSSCLGLDFSLRRRRRARSQPLAYPAAVGGYPGGGDGGE